MLQAKSVSSVSSLSLSFGVMVSRSLPLRSTSSRVISFILFFYYIFEGLLLWLIPNSLHAKKSVHGQTVLITGGGSGIGQLMAVRFAQLGACVVVWDVNQQGMSRTEEMFTEAGLDPKKTFHSYRVDITDKERVYQTAAKVRQEVGEVDILINNAGIVNGNSLLDIPDEKLRLSFEVNVLSHFYTVKAFLPSMINRKSGHVVTVASVAGNLVGCSMADYCACKFANVAFDLALRMELAQASLANSIRTSVVKPYFISTGMFAGVQSAMIPFLTPEYVADQIVSGIRAELVEIVVPYYFNTLFWLLATIPVKALVPLADFMGSFDFMAHFEGREGRVRVGEEQNNNNQLLAKQNIELNNNK